MCTSAPRAPHSAHKEVEPLEVLQKVPTQRVKSTCGAVQPFVLFNNAQRAHARMTCAVVRTPQALEGRISLLVWMDFCCSTHNRTPHRTPRYRPPLRAASLARGHTFVFDGIFGR